MLGRRHQVLEQGRLAALGGADRVEQARHGDHFPALAGDEDLSLGRIGEERLQRGALLLRVGGKFRLRLEENPEQLDEPRQVGSLRQVELDLAHTLNLKWMTSPSRTA